MEKSNKNQSLKWVLLAGVILFTCSLIVHLLVNNTNVYFDDAVYWCLGKACGWNVKNMDIGFRGWLLPYFYSICYKIGMLFNSEFLGYRIFSSLIFSFAFTVIFRFILEMLDFKKNIKETMLLGCLNAVLFFIFFRGLLIYTLSDFYALILYISSLIVMFYIFEKEQGMALKIVEAFVLGLLLYGTYNVRTIYIFSGIICLIVLVLWQLIQKKWKQLFVTVPFCVAGMTVCALPQMILNKHLLDNYSWKVPTEGLMLFQLHTGVSTGRYATYVGDKTIYSKAGMYFTDQIGQFILEKEGILEFASYGEFFKLILKYPLDFVGIYMRHLINMLYPIYPNQYIQDITQDKTILLLLFYTILFVAIFSFVNSFNLRSKRWIWIILMLVPCICILPGAVEIRFFIALHLLIYIYATVGLKEFILSFKANKFKFIICYILGFLFYIAYAGSLLATTEAGMTIINF